MATPDRPRSPQERPAPPPGPNTGGMGSVGQQPDEPTLEEKLGVDRSAQRGEPAPHGEHAAREGVPGFHEPTKEERERPEGTPGPTAPASLQLDDDTPGRVDTGTGDQPGNTGGSRTGTPPQPAPRK